MPNSIIDQPIDLFNPDGSLKDDQTIIEYLKNTNDVQTNEMYASLSLEKVKSLLRRYRIMYVTLNKEKMMRSRSNTSWASNLSLKEINCLLFIVDHDIHVLDQRCKSLQDPNEKCKEDYPIIMDVVNQTGRVIPQQSKSQSLPSLARTALQAAGMVDSLGDDNDVIKAGDTIIIKYCDGSNKTYKFTLVPLHENHKPEEHKFWVGSQLGAAVYGHKMGNKFGWKDDGGNFEATIIEIEKAQILGGHVITHHKN